MNIYQRIILIVGAIVLVAVLFTSATHGGRGHEFASVGTVMVRGFGVGGVTALLFFATKSNKKD